MKTFKLVFGIGIIVVGLYAAWQIIPPYFHHYQFDDTLEQTTRTLTYKDNTDEEIKTIVVRAAKEVDVDLTPDEVVVQRSGPSLTVSVTYSVAVDLTVTQLNLNFSSQSSGRRY